MEEIENKIVFANWNEERKKWEIYDNDDRGGINILRFNEVVDILNHYGKTGWTIRVEKEINMRNKYIFSRPKQK